MGLPLWRLMLASAERERNGPCAQRPLRGIGGLASVAAGAHRLEGTSGPKEGQQGCSKGRQVLLDSFPNYLEVDAHIVVNEDVSNAGGFGP